MVAINIIIGAMLSGKACLSPVLNGRGTSDRAKDAGLLILKQYLISGKDGVSDFCGQFNLFQTMVNSSTGFLNLLWGGMFKALNLLVEF